jgi:hypothetical protein
MLMQRPLLWWRRLLLLVVSGTVVVGLVSQQRGSCRRERPFRLGPLRQELRRSAAAIRASQEIVAEEDVEGKSTAARRRPLIHGQDEISTAAAATTETNGISPKRRQQSKVILLSLQHPEWTGRFCKTVAEVWRWKDAVLGDGRDFFVPRPKTLAALQQYLVSSSAADVVHQEPMIEAVVVLSNCARLELLLVISNINNNNDSSHEQASSSSLQEAISHALLRQVWHVQGLRFGPPPLDWPASIVTEPATFPHQNSSSSSSKDRADMLVQDLARHWKRYDTMPAILTHWCDVAAGMATRPNRPDRGGHRQDDDDRDDEDPTRIGPFRPFSSRDAHIMLQMKRLVVHGDHAVTTKWIVDTALAGGKAARSNALVHAQRSLLLDSTMPMPMSIAQQVRRDILTPLVEHALSQWHAKGAGDAIRHVRQQALALAQSDAERHAIRRSTALHNVTMALRQTQHQSCGSDHDDDHDDIVESFLRGLERRLAEQRCNTRSSSNWDEWERNQ